MEFRKVKRRFRFYPTEEQKVLLSKTFGCARLIYNKGLEFRKTSFAEGTKANFVTTSAWLTKLKKESEFEFLNEVSCVPVQQSLRHLDAAYIKFFKKQCKYPTFKSKNNRQSCEFTSRAFSFKNGELSLSKIGKLDIRWSMTLQSNPTTVTAIKEPSGKYFATLTTLELTKELPASPNQVGIDLGIETFASLSNGKKIKAPKSIRALRKNLAKQQRRHAKKKLGSKNREKARIKAVRVHEKIANIRKDFLNKLSTEIVRDNQTIVLEDLAVSNMVKNRKLARCISEQGWREFRDMLTYKSKWYGREFVTINRFTPTSKVCSSCGEKTSFGLEVREWKCGGCGAVHDRDINAAINILAAGQAVLACGEKIRPKKTYVLRRPKRQISTKQEALDANLGIPVL